MGLLIATSIFSCNIQQFCARIERLENLFGAQSWTSSNGTRLVFGEYPHVRWVYESIQDGEQIFMGVLKKMDGLEQGEEPNLEIRRLPTRGSWIVMPWFSTSMRPWYHPQKGVYTAGIEAYEEADNRVRVDFLDGYSPEDPQKDYPQIGNPFEEFANMLLDEFSTKEAITSGDFGLAGSKESRAVSIEMFEILSRRFSEEELKNFCFYLGVNYENLPANGKDSKARELILYFERREELELIAEIGAQLRPDINWPVI